MKVITRDHLRDPKDDSTWLLDDYEKRYVNTFKCLIRHGDDYHTSPEFSIPMKNQWKDGSTTTVADFTEWLSEHSKHMWWVVENYGANRIFLEFHLDFWNTQC